MIEGETNHCIFNLAPLLGTGTIVGTPTISSDPSGLTFASISVVDKTVTALVSGGAAGKDYIVKVTAVLSTGETKIKTVTLEWKAPGYDGRSAATSR